MLGRPAISPDELRCLYQRNDTCENGFGKGVTSRLLDHSSFIVAVFDVDRLVRIARAVFDGLSGRWMEYGVCSPDESGLPRV